MSPRLKDFLSRGGCGPCPECEGPHLRCTPLHSPEQVVRLGSCSHLWALRPMPRVTFSPMRKSPKNLPEGPPLWVLPLGGIIIPPAARACMRLLLPPERGETPGSMQKPNPPAAPRIDSRGCDPRCSLGRNKDRLAHKLKVANRAGFVAEGSPARCAASAKRAVRDGYSFQFNGFCVPSLEPDFVRFLKFC